MPNFSLLVRVHAPVDGALQRLLASLEAQTYGDWELVAVVQQQRAADRILLADLSALHPKLRVEVRKTDELLAWACNDLLLGLGTWIGFIDQNDQLAPGALEAVNQALLSQPEARVAYTDEESRNAYDHVSLRSAKGAINPMRLRHQEYLRDLAVFRRSWLITCDGFSRLASDRPTHDLYLRTLEAYGPAAFCYIPQRLYWRRRSHLTRHTDPRRLPHMVDYDLHAVKQHLARQDQLGQVTQVNGTLEIQYAFSHQPTVQVLLVVTDDLNTGLAAIRALDLDPVYQPRTVRVLYRGEFEENADTYAGFCAGLRFPFRRIYGSLPAALNQEALAADTQLVLFLQGVPLNTRWLHRLVDHAQLPGIAAVGARCMTPRRLTQPGILGYKYEGWDWNTRGRFNALSVPHNTACISPAALLVDTRKFAELDGFSIGSPTLYGMDFGLRLTAAGHGMVLVPASQVHVTETSVPAAEAEAFRLQWAGWGDSWGLHLSL